MRSKDTISAKLTTLPQIHHPRHQSMQSAEFTQLVPDRPAPHALSIQVSPRNYNGSNNYKIASSINSNLVNDQLHFTDEKRLRVDTYGILRERAGHSKPKSLLRAERNCVRYFSNLGSVNYSNATSRDVSPKAGPGRVSVAHPLQFQHQQVGLPSLKPISSVHIKGQNDTINEAATPNEGTPR